MMNESFDQSYINQISFYVCFHGSKGHEKEVQRHTLPPILLLKNDEFNLKMELLNNSLGQLKEVQVQPSRVHMTYWGALKNKMFFWMATASLLLGCITFRISNLLIKLFTFLSHA
jgi:hypothetical protein